MADGTSYTEVTRVKVYSLKLPTNLTEVSKLMSWAKQAFDATGEKYWDDSITVDSDDEKLRFTFELSKEIEKS